MAKRDIRFMKGLLIGGAAASLVTLLLAPKTGRALRSDITKRGRAWGSRAAAKATEVSTQGSARLQEARQHMALKLGVVGQHAGSMVDSLRNRTDEPTSTSDAEGSSGTRRPNSETPRAEEPQS